MKELGQGIPRSLLPIALATSTMHYYVCVIILPVLIQTKFASLSSFEVGVMLAG